MDRVRVNEGSNLLVEFDILDLNGDPVSVDSLTAASLTLYDVDTGLRSGSPSPGILNNRDQQDILASGSPYIENDVEIDTDGHVLWTMQPEDNIIVTPRRQVERHRAQFHFEWAGGAFNYEVEIELVNLRMAE